VELKAIKLIDFHQVALILRRTQAREQSSGIEGNRIHQLQ
jgi:hypothetical protein